MNNKLKNLLNLYSLEIRKTINLKIEEINGDFSGWCELCSMYMYRVVKEFLLQIKTNEFICGKFNDNGHYWNRVDEVIVDLTIDQFGDYKVGIIDKQHYEKYSIEKINILDEKDLINITNEFLDLMLFNISNNKEYKEYYNR